MFVRCSELAEASSAFGNEDAALVCGWRKPCAAQGGGLKELGLLSLEKRRFWELLVAL